MYSVDAIGTVRSPRREAADDRGAVVSELELGASHLRWDATAGLADFMHVVVVLLLHLIEPGSVFRGARRPRGNPDWPEVGILAQHAKARPDRTGVTVRDLLAVDGLRLRVRGLDAIHGTPLLDVKPFKRDFAPRGDIRLPRWATELMARYL